MRGRQPGRTRPGRRCRLPTGTHRAGLTREDPCRAGRRARLGSGGERRQLSRVGPHRRTTRCEREHLGARAADQPTGRRRSHRRDEHRLAQLEVRRATARCRSTKAHPQGFRRAALAHSAARARRFARLLPGTHRPGSARRVRTRRGDQRDGGPAAGDQSGYRRRPAGQLRRRRDPPDLRGLRPAAARLRSRTPGRALRPGNRVRSFTGRQERLHGRGRGVHQRRRRPPHRADTRGRAHRHPHRLHAGGVAAADRGVRLRRQAQACSGAGPGCRGPVLFRRGPRSPRTQAARTGTWGRRGAAGHRRLLLLLPWSYNSLARPAVHGFTTRESDIRFAAVRPEQTLVEILAESGVDQADALLFSDVDSTPAHAGTPAPARCVQTEARSWH